MEPPSYEEASLHPPALGTRALNIPPPPPYDANLHSPSTPPPTYGEAVTIQPDPFPVLTPPRVPTTVTSPPQNTGIIIHPLTQIGVTPPVSTRPTQTVVVTQPQPVPISVTCLRRDPGLVCCPHCHHIVTTEVTYKPGEDVFFLCLFLSMIGLVCGFCLIPFMIRGLHDAHHSCPRCRNTLHIHKR